MKKQVTVAELIEDLKKFPSTALVVTRQYSNLEDLKLPTSKLVVFKPSLGSYEDVTSNLEHSCSHHEPMATRVNVLTDEREVKLDGRWRRLLNVVYFEGN